MPGRILTKSLTSHSLATFRRQVPPSYSYQSYFTSRFCCEDTDDSLKTKRRLDVAIVGAPNAGKSQLLNAMTSTTVAAVSRKRHTTRTDILATRTIDDSQLVFIDTPGFMNMKTARDEALFKDLVRDARAGIEDADYTLVVVDAAKNITDDLKEALTSLFIQANQSGGRLDDVSMDDQGKVVKIKAPEHQHEKFAIVLNKVDLVSPKTKLLEIANEIGLLGDKCVQYEFQVLNDGADFDLKKKTESAEERKRWLAQSPPVFFISAKQNDGVEDLASYLHKLSTPTTDFALPPGEVTSMSLAERIEEIIREKIYRCLHKEVPHHIRQMNRVLRKGRTKDGKSVLRVEQVLLVRTKSHHRLVMGRSGKTLKRIEDTAKRDLIDNLSSEGIHDVLLKIHVKLNTSQDHIRGLETDGYGALQSYHD